MTDEATYWRAAKALLDEPTDRFVDLVEAAGLNRARAFRHGDLRECDLQGEDLRGFDFSGADLSRANLTGADLSGTFGLESAILDGAIWDETTKWPRPLWADVSGRDDFGPWASFTLTPKGGSEVTQRLRWIPPGTFRIGSPAYEEGRFPDEDDGVDIAFARGFWMFETPCTQALWMAVMRPKTNPSGFKDNLGRPVENVSFVQVGRFVQRLNKLKRGLDLSLPSEAQWEYACRAGTIGATWAGPTVLDGKDNAAVLDPIAWWEGNSGNETHSVGQRQPNPWGLYDMLGNVWEWCADEWHGSHEGVRADGAARGRGVRPATRGEPAEVAECSTGSLPSRCTPATPRPKI